MKIYLVDKYVLRALRRIYKYKYDIASAKSAISKGICTEEWKLFLDKAIELRKEECIDLKERLELFNK